MVERLHNKVDARVNEKLQHKQSTILLTARKVEEEADEDEKAAELGSDLRKMAISVACR